MQAGATREPTMGWLFFSPSGRLSRKPFALGWLFWIMLMSIPVVQMVHYEGNQTAAGLFFILFAGIAIAATISSVMLTIKRLHDMGVPAALCICLFIPAISFIALIAFCLWPGKNGPNEFGSLPNRPRDGRTAD